MIFLAAFIGALLFFVALIFILRTLIRSRKEVSEKLQYYTGYTPHVVEKKSGARVVWDKIHGAFARQARNRGPSRYSRWDILMYRAGLPLLGREFLTLSGVGALILFLMASFITKEPLNGLIAALCFLIVDYVYVRRKAAKRLETFQGQLHDCLTLVANSLRAGFSFLQTMEIVAHEMKPPMSSEFDRVMRDTRLGRTMEEALRGMDDRVGSPDFSLVVTAVLIQQQVGGNLADILDTIRETITERVRIRREIMTLTAQGRMSGIVLALIPLALALFFYISSPKYLEPLLTTNIGHICIGAALIMEVIGFIIIYKIVDIKV